MATASAGHLLRRPLPAALFTGLQRPTAPKFAGNHLSPLRPSKNGNPFAVSGWNSKWVARSRSVEQRQPTPAAERGLKGLVEFLYADLPHLFDDQGIDPSMYDERVRFRDPITKHETIEGYLFNIRLLKALFRPHFQLHRVKQTGPYEITTRWTMVMKFILLPWKPELVFTGISIMGVNPQTQKFCSHVDIWDSIENNDYFSFEGLWDVLQQLRIYRTPDLETPKYHIMKRTASYEVPIMLGESNITLVRKYASFVVAETKGDKLYGSSGFSDVAGYIFGKNSAMEKYPMTTPVFTQALDDKLKDVSIQIVLPVDKDLNNLPAPSVESVNLRKVGGIAAVTKFSGRPTEEVVRNKERDLRSALLEDGIKPQPGCLLARYNDPGSTWSFLMSFKTFNFFDSWIQRGTRC